MLGVYDIRRLIDTCSKLPDIFAVILVPESSYAHAQLSSLYLLSTFTASHMRKNNRLSTLAQFQCLHSGAWEPGNKAIVGGHILC